MFRIQEYTNSSYIIRIYDQNLCIDWIDKGGTIKTFLSTYPPEKYVNPTATNLPKELMPKAKTTGRDNF